MACDCFLVPVFLPVARAGRWKDVVVKAICDPSRTCVAWAAKELGAEVMVYEDHRRLLEMNPDIDAIVCDTPDHRHARVCLDALHAGKHVYVGRPFTRHLGEAFEVYDAVLKTGKVLQVGVCSTSNQKWHEAADWIRAGRIGRPVMCMGSYMRNNPRGEWNVPLQPWASAEDINWALWLGETADPGHAFSAEEYFRWRKYWRYSAGLLAALLPDKLCTYLLATGNPEFPARVACLGTCKIGTDRKSPAPMRDVPEFVQLVTKFPSGLTFSLIASSVNEFGTQEVIRGEKASLLMAGNKVELRPEPPFVGEIEAAVSRLFPAESHEAHIRNFFDAIRGEAQPNAGIELAIRAQTIASLAEMSDRLNVMCSFDERTRTVTDGRGRNLPLRFETATDSWH